MVEEKISNVPCESGQNVEGRETRFLQTITFKLLKHIEKAAELCNDTKITDEKLSRLEKTTQLLFGSKKSLADALINLAELSIKINQSTINSKAKESEEGQACILSDYDIALVQAFITKQRSKNLVSAEVSTSNVSLTHRKTNENTE